MYAPHVDTTTQKEKAGLFTPAFRDNFQIETSLHESACYEARTSVEMVILSLTITPPPLGP